MRKLTRGLCAAAALVLIAGCAGNTTTSSSSSPLGGGAGAAPAHVLPAPGFFTAVSAVPQKFIHLKHKHHGTTPVDQKGIYVSAFSATAVYGFPKNNSGNSPSTCNVSVTGAVNDMTTDNSGNLMVPDGDARAIRVFQGPTMCGSQIGDIADSYGQPASVSAVNAATGEMAVGNIFDNSVSYGSISVCSIASGCTANLTNPEMGEVAGVAMSANGDCWASALNPSSVAVLVYFQGCTGSGQVATGFSQGYYGGLDIDNKGNLVSTSLFAPSFQTPSTVTVFSGCNPACTEVSSSQLTDLSIFGHVGKHSLRYVTTDLSSSDVEVYSYSPTAGVKLLYSFTGGLPCATDECEAAAYSPSSQK